MTFRDLLAHRTCLKPDLIGQLTDAFDGFEDYVVYVFLKYEIVQCKKI